MYDTVIRNGVVVSGDVIMEADVAVQGAQIAALGLGLEGRRELDAAGCYLIPGAVDPHVHLQMPLHGLVSADSFASGTRAAAYGGTTTVIDFVTPAQGQDMLDALAERQAEADGVVAVDYGLHMTVPAWHAASFDRLEQLHGAVRAGCATVKLYQAYTDLALDDVSLYRALKVIGLAGGAAVLHSENGPVLDELRAAAVAAGHRQPIWHARTRPARLEASAVQRAAELAHLADCPLYLFHVGAAEVVAQLVATRLQGVSLFAESCPHYLLLSAERELAGPDGTLFVCAPPLRSAQDQELIWQALAEDDLQVVSSDHCPWTRLEKEQPDFSQIPGGLPGIEARLSLVYHCGVGQGRLSLERWVQLCCTNPAQLMGLHRKGLLAPGYDADLVIFDPTREITLDTGSLHETAGWTPYAGITISGWPRTVLLRGQAIVVDEHYVGDEGDGQYVARGLG